MAWESQTVMSDAGSIKAGMVPLGFIFKKLSVRFSSRYKLMYLQVDVSQLRNEFCAGISGSSHLSSTSSPISLATAKTARQLGLDFE